MAEENKESPDRSVGKKEQQEEVGETPEEKKEEPVKEKEKAEVKEEPAAEPKEEKPEEKKPEAPTPPGVGVPTSVGKKPTPKAPPSGKFKDLIEKIEKLTVAELAEFVKTLEERLGVSPGIGVAPPAPSGAVAPQGPPPKGAPVEKATYTLMLESAGDNKIQAIKAVREINQDLGLKEAKDLVEAAPKEVKKELPKAEAEEALKKLEAAGAKASLK